jgi:hypothetical protein
MVNLVLAFVWLAVGLGILLWPWLDPEAKVGRVDPTLGWVALILCCYNLARWWVSRAAARERQAMREQLARCQSTETEARPERPPDPNFDFTDRAGE